MHLMEKQTDLQRLFSRLLQNYIYLESAALSNNSDQCNQIAKEINKSYDSIFELNFHELEEKDLWLYYNLKDAHKARIGMNEVFSNLTDQLLKEWDEEDNFTKASSKELKFYKENGIWFIDLPHFLNNGLGTKANLMMVDGADTFLDKLSNNGNSVKVKASTSRYEGFEARITLQERGKNQALLDQLGHAQVDYGAYYLLDIFKGFEANDVMWLCPVTEYVFGGKYPEKIWLNVII